MLLDQAVMRDLTQLRSHGKTANTCAQAWQGVVWHMHSSVCCIGQWHTLMMSDAYILMQPRLNVIAGTCATRSSQVQ